MMIHYEQANYRDGSPDYFRRKIHPRIHSASDFLKYGNCAAKRPMLTGYNLDCGLAVSG
jgi:hypothetical protein